MEVSTTTTKRRQKRRTKKVQQPQYRKPTIDEFVNGFEYEVYSDGTWDSIEDVKGWYQYTVGLTCWRQRDVIESELKMGNIRVLI